MNIPMMVANAMNKRTLIKEIEKAAHQYDLIPSETSEKVLMTFVGLFIKKMACEKWGVDNASKKVDDVEKIFDMLASPKTKEN